MACYAVYLASGNTLLCRSIKSSTLTTYLDAVAHLYLSHNFANPTRDFTGRTALKIKEVISEQKRWEQMSNRKEPLTWDMVHHHSSFHSLVPPDSLNHAISDWLIVGMYTGFRLSEWAQSCSTLRSLRDVARNRCGLPTACLLADVQFRSASNLLLPTYDTSAMYVQIRWRVQKNNDNGQIISFARHPSPERCPVLAMHRIITRSKRLCHDSSLPLAIYLTSSSKVRYFTDHDITSVLRSTAKTLYNLHKQSDLARWTAHSIRVGACVALHEAGCDGITIQQRLRWRSNTYLMYLRNTRHLADQHTQFFTPQNN